MGVVKRYIRLFTVWGSYAIGSQEDQTLRTVAIWITIGLERKKPQGGDRAFHLEPRTTSPVRHQVHHKWTNRTIPVNNIMPIHRTNRREVWCSPSQHEEREFFLLPYKHIDWARVAPPDEREPSSRHTEHIESTRGRYSTGRGGRNDWLINNWMARGGGQMQEVWGFSLFTGEAPALLKENWSN